MKLEIMYSFHMTTNSNLFSHNNILAFSEGDQLHENIATYSSCFIL